MIRLIRSGEVEFLDRRLCTRYFNRHFEMRSQGMEDVESFDLLYVNSRREARKKMRFRWPS